MKRVRDCAKHYVGPDFHCGWPTRSIIGEIVMGQYPGGFHVEISWTGIDDCECGDWDRCVRGLVDDKGECRELVPSEWSVIYLAHRHPVYRVEGNQALRAEQKEDWSNASESAR